MDASRLAEISLFQGLRQPQLQQLWSAAAQHSLDAGTYIFKQGDPAERLYVLLAGKVRLTQTTPDGQQLILRYASPGQAFGVLAVLSNASYPVAAQAVDASQAISWGKNEMGFFMEKYPKVALNGMGILARRVQEFQDRLRELSTERVERRVARAVLRLAQQTGRLTQEGVLIDMPLSRQDLAEMTGTTLYTVSRILSQWEGRGLVESKRERVVVRFPHGLVAIAEDLPEPHRGEAGE